MRKMTPKRIETVYPIGTLLDVYVAVNHQEQGRFLALIIGHAEHGAMMLWITDDGPMYVGCADDDTPVHWSTIDYWLNHGAKVLA